MCRTSMPGRTRTTRREHSVTTGRGRGRRGGARSRSSAGAGSSGQAAPPPPLSALLPLPLTRNLTRNGPVSLTCERWLWHRFFGSGTDSLVTRAQFLGWIFSRSTVPALPLWLSARASPLQFSVALAAAHHRPTATAAPTTLSAATFYQPPTNRLHRLHHRLPRRPWPRSRRRRLMSSCRPSGTPQWRKPPKRRRARIRSGKQALRGDPTRPACAHPPVIWTASPAAVAPLDFLFHFIDPLRGGERKVWVGTRRRARKCLASGIAIVTLRFRFSRKKQRGQYLVNLLFVLCRKTPWPRRPSHEGRVERPEASAPPACFRGVGIDVRFSYFS